MLEEQLRDDFPDLEINIHDRGDTAVLERVVVPEDQRGRGRGSAFLEELTDIADERDVMLALEPSTDFGATSRDRLIDFYGRYGFVKNEGRHKDFSVRESLIRQPR